MIEKDQLLSPLRTVTAPPPESAAVPAVAFLPLKAPANPESPPEIVAVPCDVFCAEAATAPPPDTNARKTFPPAAATPPAAERIACASAVLRIAPATVPFPETKADPDFATAGSGSCSSIQVQYARPPPPPFAPTRTRSWE